MGGTLGLTSTLGQGSTFSIELPRVEGPVERYERLTGRTEPHLEPAAQRQVVLHIEDNLSNLTLVERVLAQRAGIEVVAAMRGAVPASSSPASTNPSWCRWTRAPARHGRRAWSCSGCGTIGPPGRSPPSSSSRTPLRARCSVLSAPEPVAYLSKPIDVRELLSLLDDAVGCR